MEHLMAALMLWAGAQTGLPVPDRLPRIVEVEQCELEAQVYGEHTDCEDDWVVFATYMPGTISVPTGWTPDTAFQVSLLLHELVHHMQFEAGIAHRCPGELEPQAYEAQIAFLEAAGIPGYETIGTDEFTVRSGAICEGLY